MDSKTFTQKLAANLGYDTKRTANFIDKFATILRTNAVDMNTVAVPSFGSFVPTKFDETIVQDHSTGKRLMLPPQISLEFQPAAMLRKKLSGHE